MKKYFVLAAAFIFSCTSKIEDPDSVLREGGYLGGVSSSSVVSNPGPGPGGDVSSSSVGGNPLPPEGSSSSVGGTPSPPPGSSSSAGGSPSPNVSSSSSVAGGSSPSGVSSSSAGAREPYDVLSDIHFENDIGKSASSWTRQTVKNGSIRWLQNSSSSGYYVRFSPGSQDTADWHTQLKQKINYEFAFSYTLDVVGKANNAITGNIMFAIIRCWGDNLESCGDDAMNFETPFNLTLRTYRYNWNNCKNKEYANASFVASAGFARESFDIYSISISAVPCSTTNPCCGIGIQ